MISKLKDNRLSFVLIRRFCILVFCLFLFIYLFIYLYKDLDFVFIGVKLHALFLHIVEVQNKKRKIQLLNIQYFEVNDFDVGN